MRKNIFFLKKTTCFSSSLDFHVVVNWELHKHVHIVHLNFSDLLYSTMAAASGLKTRGYDHVGFYCHNNISVQKLGDISLRYTEGDVATVQKAWKSLLPLLTSCLPTLALTWQYCMSGDTYRSGENDEVSCCTSSASGFAVLCSGQCCVWTLG